MLIIGHRGACGYEPENTLRSYKKALEIGVDMVEGDVYITTDGKIVLMHDNKIDRTTDGKGNVFEKKLTELRKYDAGKGEKIPLLEEVFDLVNGKVPINVELKGEGTAKPVAKLIEKYVKRGWSYSDFIVSSFNHRELQIFSQICRKVKVGALFSGLPLISKPEGIKIDYIDVLQKNMKNLYSINLGLDFINQKTVDYAHKKGLKVFVYTVNDMDDMQKMKRMKIDGIFTNYPDRAKMLK